MFQTRVGPDSVGLDITPSVILNKSGLDVECGA